MHLVVVAQAIDPRDPLLGSFADWVLELSRRVDRLTAFALRAQMTSWPPHVQVHALASGDSWRRSLELSHRLWALSAGTPVDAIFVHMCPEYAMLCAPVARLRRIPVILWYAHGAVTRRLRLAVRLGPLVVTSSPEGFRAPARCTVIGQGIDTDRFRPAATASAGPRRLLSVGRLSPVKRYERVLSAVARLVHQEGLDDVELDIVGGPARPGDAQYVSGLQRLARSLKLDDRVRWRGPIPYTQMPQVYQACTALISASETGSLDRAVLEAMACGKPMMTTSPAFTDLLAGEGLCADDDDPASLSDQAAKLMHCSEAERAAIGLRLRERVIDEHGLRQWGARLRDVLGQATQWR